MRRLLLVTAFEPFGGSARNPSAEVLNAIAGGRTDLVAEVLPVVFATAGARVAELIAEHRPAAWVGLGLDGGATAIKLERRAANLDDAALLDNAGDVRRGVPIDPAGPDVRLATLPLAAMAAAVPSVVYSDSAGRFVCNHTFYRAAAAAARLTPAPLVGFVHVPWPADWPTNGRRASHAVTFAELTMAVANLLSAVALAASQR